MIAREKSSQIFKAARSFDSNHEAGSSVFAVGIGGFVWLKEYSQDVGAVLCIWKKEHRKSKNEKGGRQF
jgi:hypothetical protein